MSMLTEKRQEIAAKLESLLKARNDSINEKLVAYRIQLEAEPESAEIVKAREVLKAMDEVILYEANVIKPEPIIVEPVVEPAAESVIEAEPIIEPIADNIVAEPIEPDKAKTESVVENNESVTEAEPAVEEVKIVAEADETKVEITVDKDSTFSIKEQESERRPGMAYVGIPERR